MVDSRLVLDFQQFLHHELDHHKQVFLNQVKTRVNLLKCIKYKRAKSLVVKGNLILVKQFKSYKAKLMSLYLVKESYKKEIKRVNLLIKMLRKKKMSMKQRCFQSIVVQIRRRAFKTPIDLCLNLNKKHLKNNMGTAPQISST